jgi:hypothetical protein
MEFCLLYGRFPLLRAPSRLCRAAGAAAVFRNGVSVGTIESRNGNARAAPAPRRISRREICFFVMYILKRSLLLRFALSHQRGLGYGRQLRFCPPI